MERRHKKSEKPKPKKQQAKSETLGLSRAAYLTDTIFKLLRYSHDSLFVSKANFKKKTAKSQGKLLTENESSRCRCSNCWENGKWHNSRVRNENYARKFPFTPAPSPLIMSACSLCKHRRTLAQFQAINSYDLEAQLRPYRSDNPRLSRRVHRQAANTS